MAQQRPGHDPATVTAAMSAIEQALNLSSGNMTDVAAGTMAASEKSQHAEPVLDIKLPHVNTVATALKPVGEPVSAGTEAISTSTSALNPATPPANDDRKVVGSIAQAMNIRTSDLPIALAMLASALWLGLVGFYIVKATATDTSGGLTSIMDNSQFPSWLLLGLGPVVFFLVVAALIRRIQEIRITAQSMAAVAMRLADPETLAAEQVVTLSQAIRREVASMGDGIERALARASELETMVRTEVSNLERSYTDNERRIRILVDGLASEREAIVSYADRVRTAITGAHDKMSEGLEDVSRSLTERMANVGNTVTSSLSSKGEEIVVTLHSSNEAFLQKLSEQSNLLKDKVGQTSDEIARSIDMRIQDLDQHFRQTGAALTSEFIGISETINERFSSTGQEIAEKVLNNGYKIADQLNETSAMLEHTVGIQGESLVQRLAETGGQFSDILVKRTLEAQEVFHASAEALSAKMDMQQTQIQHELTRQSTVLSEHFVQTSQHAIETMSEHADLIRQNLDTTVEHTAQVLNAQFIGTAENVLSTFADRAESLDQKFAQTAKEAIDAVVTHSDKITGTIAERLNYFEENVIKHGAALADRVISGADRITHNVDQKLGAVETVFTVHGENFLNALENRTHKASEQLEAHMTEFEQRASSKSQEISSSLDSLISKIDAGLDARAHSLNDMLAHRAVDVAKVLGDGGREMTRALDTKANEINQILIQRSTALTETLSNKAEEINSALGGKATEIANTLDDRIGVFENRIVNRLDIVSTELNDRGNIVVSILQERGKDIAAMLEAQSSALENGTVTIRELLENEGLGLVKALSERGGDVSREIAEIGDLVIRAIELRGTAIVTQLTHQQGELTDAIDTSSGKLRSNIEDNTASVVASLIDTNAKVQSDISTLLSELDQRNQTLKTLSGDATQNLSLIEYNLGARVKEFDTALNLVKQQIMTLAQTSASTLNGAQTIAEKLYVQGKNLTETSDQLIRAQKDNDSSLEARIESLESLLARVNERSHDLDQIMHNFTAVIEDSVKTAEMRARDIGSYLAETTQSVQTTMGQQFETLRSTAGKEREKTSSALRAAYDQTKTEMEDIFAGTAARFKDSTEELMNMSNAIRNELEATREELRRSTAELPQETMAQTANLRRIVTDQINALNELTDIATRSGRSIDVASAETASARRTPEPAPKLRAPEPARLPESQPVKSRAPARLPEAQVTIPQHRAVSQPAAAAQREDFMRVRAPLTPPVVPTRPNPAPAQAEERGAGWLSDLLSRASQDENTSAVRTSPPSPQTQPIGSLDSISLDIARMIDHNTAVAMWDRYRNGERQVFSHRLYTQQGQNTFDEIRRRYRSDADFRETVNHYITEFERLDSEVSRNDRDGNLTRAFLVSDTGKVYTMLAHAAGRLD